MDTVTFEHIYFTVINSVVKYINFTNKNKYFFNCAFDLQEHSLDQAEKFIQVRNNLAKSQPRDREAFRDVIFVKFTGSFAIILKSIFLLQGTTTAA